ncbi:hypothetical protein [Desulfuribacillus alkaliarsenatis]|uniref:Uncharacterized protein n=1 Tax=Desulfuribacillus alkaliarsenatis TaxID=766136 RepID=A0A1E5G259_9FIRM|nr:hypothetical protein [Desulfuribacillus alkaliarsenatis]OEF96987.1 hypothetical protein BHF68_05120 [Desulfuribacillus alkaliarsenatis]
MKRFLFISLIVLTIVALIGCSKQASNELSEEEMREQIRAELEAEQQGEQQTEQTEQESQGSQSNQQAPTQQQQRTQQQPAQQQPTQPAAKPQQSGNPLIDSYNEQGKTVFYRFRTNETVLFDLNDDGNKEAIIYRTGTTESPGELVVSGFEPIEIWDMPFGETEYFVIIRYKDEYNLEMNMIGIIDYGPSMDYTTTFYSIIAPMGEDWFGYVGDVGGKLVPPTEYNDSNQGGIDTDWNYKAVLRYGEGIEAPVRLSVTPGSWYGRNIFTYYTTYKTLIDNIDKYNRDYRTDLDLKVERSIKLYDEKSLSSSTTVLEAGQIVQMAMTDNAEWIYMIARDGTKGWARVSDVTESNFSGFLIFG